MMTGLPTLNIPMIKDAPYSEEDAKFWDWIAFLMIVFVIAVAVLVAVFH